MGCSSCFSGWSWAPGLKKPSHFDLPSGFLPFLAVISLYAAMFIKSVGFKACQNWDLVILKYYHHLSSTTHPASESHLHSNLHNKGSGLFQISASDPPAYSCPTYRYLLLFVMRLEQPKPEWPKTKSIGFLEATQVFSLIQKQRTEIQHQHFLNNMGWVGRSSF